MLRAHEAYKHADSQQLKDELLDLYSKDKTCKWIETWSHKVKETTVEKNSSKKGWMSRNDVSILLWQKPAAEKPCNDTELLKKILAKCKTDEDWDTSKPYEAVMKELGELRYWFEKTDWSTDESARAEELTKREDLDKNRF